jgi:hypothetical protein
MSHAEKTGITLLQDRFLLCAKVVEKENKLKGIRNS